MTITDTEAIADSLFVFLDRIGCGEFAQDMYYDFYDDGTYVFEASEAVDLMWWALSGVEAEEDQYGI